jgi:hypothetical protein
VYDDIDGWNKNPYLGSQEFYNDFCDFDVYITVPKNYIVCATGDLQNASDVYLPSVVQRIATAEASDAITRIIDTSDRQVTTQNERNTWKFQAGNVTDFAFATSNHYIWYASSLVVGSLPRQEGTRVGCGVQPSS